MGTNCGGETAGTAWSHAPCLLVPASLADTGGGLAATLRSAALPGPGLTAGRHS